MIIYSRRIGEQARQTRLGLARFRKHLNFFRFLEKQRTDILSLLSSEAGRKLLSNLAAATVTQLVYRHHIPPRTRTREYEANDPPLVDILSKLFDQKTQSLGYVQTTNAQRWRESHPGRVFLVILGCQTDSILERRVRAAVRLVTAAELTEAMVVFSGANPTYANDPSHEASDSSAIAKAPSNGTQSPAPEEEDEARIIDEAAQMCSLFEAELGPAEISRLKLHLHNESESGKTGQNIARSMQKLGEEIATFDHIVVVSSSFHLPRVSDTAFRVLSAQQLPFKTISLVGSELPYSNGSAIRWDVDYLRSSFYEAMRILLEESDPESLVRRDAH